MEEREHFYAPSHTNSLRTVEPPTSHYASSMKPSYHRQWNSSSTNVSKGMFNTVEPKSSPLFIGIISGVAALLAAIFAMGIYGTVALSTPQSTNMTTVIDLPIGATLMYAGNALALSDQNSRWLFCNGSEVSRTTYQALFAVIGTIYGVGNGIDTFNLPDFRSQFPLGTNGTNDTYLTMGGNASHTITVTELPAHTHDQGTLLTQTNGAHTHGYTDPGHSHTGATTSVWVPTYGNGIPWNGQWGLTALSYHLHGIYADFTGITIQSDGSHTHIISGSTGSQGQGQPIKALPSYQTVHHIIRV
ncbi:unnamed protein product [Rotaria magnacalcarata]|uniref:Phage tail collar domain-containing protein n=2 Tax=Rotaria magnacalcarata TaxID=392030 RepID=A0A816M5H2_9BILA|nr:unnamed protein product [Rotaria magnacalcarata]